MTRLSWRKCQKVAPSCRGFFGAPRLVVLPVGHQAGQRLVELLGVQRRSELDYAGDLDGAEVAFRVRDAGGYDDGLPRFGCAPARRRR